MKCDTYCQCRLSREAKLGGIEYKVTWLPTIYAKVNSILRLKNEDGSWSNGWKVLHVSSPENAKVVEANARNYLKQRKASDIIFSDIKKQNEEN